MATYTPLTKAAGVAGNRMKEMVSLNLWIYLG